MAGKDQEAWEWVPSLVAKPPGQGAHRGRGELSQPSFRPPRESPSRPAGGSAQALPTRMPAVVPSCRCLIAEEAQFCRRHGLFKAPITEGHTHFAVLALGKADHRVVSDFKGVRSGILPCAGKEQ
ncbi:hypothetical protein H1C71_008980 [Ictidomys tridecemlineatus]|nr:hypothetical protein H1C71_008980 [Ictidomys tridecemlineatus]